MGQEGLSLLSALMYLLNILSNAQRQKEELSITLSDQTRFAVKRKVARVCYTERLLQLKSQQIQRCGTFPED